METHPQLTLCQAGSKPRGKGGKGGKDLSKQGEMMGEKIKRNGSFKSVSWVMKIQELPVLAFITKLFLEGKAGINLVFEAWGGLGSGCLFYLPVPLCFLGKAAPGQGWNKPKCLAFTPSSWLPGNRFVLFCGVTGSRIGTARAAASLIPVRNQAQPSSSSTESSQEKPPAPRARPQSESPL